MCIVEERKRERLMSIRVEGWHEVGNVYNIIYGVWHMHVVLSMLSLSCLTSLLVTQLHTCMHMDIIVML